MLKDANNASENGETTEKPQNFTQIWQLPNSKKEMN